MSLSYAESLSYFPHKGKVGMPELNEKPDELKTKLERLEQMIRESHHTVVITGAGISTDAGIPDFRGPNGVWTLEKRGEKPTFNTGFEQAAPTYTHRALCKLEENHYLHFVISQNIDGLHHRSGLPLEKLAELHGNVFSEECEVCHTQIIRPTCVGSFCRKRTGNVCNSLKGRNKNLSCRGKLRDTVLDWEDALPEPALKLSEQHCAKADLCLCLGTSLQIRPCRDLPRKTKKNGGRVVIVNLQKTTMDSVADLIIHERCDHVMKYILQKLHLLDEDKPSTIDTSKYAHVKKIVLLSGRSTLGEKLAIDLQALLLHLQQSVQIEYAKSKDKTWSESDREEAFKWESEKSREDPTRFCRALIEHNADSCSKHSVWIIDDIQRQTDIDFFRTYFNDRLLLVRVATSNDKDEECASNSMSDMDPNISWSFTLSNDEQMNDLLGMIRS